MRFNGSDGSLLILPLLSAVILFSRLEFLHPVGSPIIPRETAQLPLPHAQLIACIDLLGPPERTSKTVIENAAWQASRSAGGWEASCSRLADALASAGVATLMPPPRMLTQSLPKTRGQKIIVSYQPFTCLREAMAILHTIRLRPTVLVLWRPCIIYSSTFPISWNLPLFLFVCFFFFPRWAVLSSANPHLFPHSHLFCWEKQQNFKTWTFVKY